MHEELTLWRALMQVPLEVGDEVYVFEVFRPISRPDSNNAGVWYRGYVVSTSPQPRLPFASSDIYSFSATPASVPLSDEYVNSDVVRSPAR